MVVAIEEMFWADAGIGMAIMGSGLAAAGILASATPEQVGEFVPQCYGTPGDVKLGAFCASEPDAGSDVAGYRTRAVYDEATDEWVLNGTKAWITNGGIADIHVVVAVVDPELGSKGHASFVVPPNTPGLSQGQKYKKHASGHRTPPRSCSTTSASPADACSVAARSCSSATPGCAKARRATPRPPCRRSRPLAPQWAPRPSASPGPPTSTPSTTPRSARPSASRSCSTRASASCWPDMATEVDAARLLVHRAAWLAKNGEFKNAEGSMAKMKAGTHRHVGHRRAIQILGGYGYTRRVPGGAVAPRREDHGHLRGHRADPAARDQPGHLRHAGGVTRAGVPDGRRDNLIAGSAPTVEPVDHAREPVRRRDRPLLRA